MTAGIKGLLHSLQRSLREDVRPELQSDHARAQLAGALDILAKLEPLVDWSPALVEAQARPLREALDRAEEAARAAGCPLSLAGAQPEDRVRQLIDLAFDASTRWPPALRQQVHALLQPALRQSVGAQRRLIPKTDFSSMTSARD
jgi:hypothetical protein